VFPSRLHEEGLTAEIPLDISHHLGCSYPATSPALLANFVHILPGEHLKIQHNATSHLFYVMRGQGHTQVNDQDIAWSAGDFFILPQHQEALHHAETDSALYYVHDEPLLNYLGVQATSMRFKPTLYTRDKSEAALKKVTNAADAGTKNRISVLLANKELPQTRTISHVLWAMFGILPAHDIQLPHRHQSVALDLALECQPGCYTLIGEALDNQGAIVNPVRADWKPFSAFITPPGYWHSHHNDSAHDAHVIPIQDAGLHTYFRTLDIQFFKR
jgi:gentisate 1,2-dioxygenase